MTRIVVSSSLGLVVGGEIVSWDDEQENGTAVIAGVEYDVYQSYDGDGYIALFDADADVFMRCCDEVKGCGQ